MLSHTRLSVSSNKYTQITAPGAGRHCIVVWLCRHPLCNLIQAGAQSREGGGVSDDLTPVGHPHYGLHQLHQGPVVHSAPCEGVGGGVAHPACGEREEEE